MNVLQCVLLHVDIRVNIVVRIIAVWLVMEHVHTDVLNLVILYTVMFYRDYYMRKRIILLLFFYPYMAYTQNISDTTILETRFRNPIDTVTISVGKHPSIVLFVHSNCRNNNCSTGQLLKALCEDSLDLRKNNNIKLYVVYPNEYSKMDVDEFDSYSPENAVVAFDIGGTYRRKFGFNINVTPFVVIFDGKGNKIVQEGGTYKKIYNKTLSFLVH